MTTDTQALIAERGKTHGDFEQTANTAALLKLIMRDPANTTGVCEQIPPIGEALDMLAVKLARFVCGNWREPDHLRDAICYLYLAQQAVARAIAREAADAKNTDAA